MTVPVARRAARAILIDTAGRLVLIKRSRPGQPPYWTTPGGGVDENDTSGQEALLRELREELGAEVTGLSLVFLFSTLVNTGITIQHFFVAQLVSVDEAARTGHEFADRSRGTSDVERVDLHGNALNAVDLRPEALKTFILANRYALLTEAETAS